MAEKSDLSPEASAIKAAQKARLRRMRQVVAPSQLAASEAAGVSVSSWNRQEVGDNEVDAIALARFCDAYEVPAEYVITGNLSGFDHTGRAQAHLRRLVEMELAERVAAHAAGAKDSVEPLARLPASKSPQTHNLSRRKVLKSHVEG